MAYLSPIGNEQQNDANGDPLSGGKILTYAAGTSTAATTYTGEDEGAAQANPIVLNASGLPASPIWLQGGTSYKFVITDANDVVLRTIDDITGINDPSLSNAVDQWVLHTGSPTYISATSFSLTGDQTNGLHATRRLKTTNTGGTVYSSIASSSYSAGTGLTTVTVTNDSGSLDSGLSAVAYGILGNTNPSIPETSTGQALRVASSASAARVVTDAQAPTFRAYQSAAQSIADSTATKLNFNTKDWDATTAFSTANSRFTPLVAGYYLIGGTYGTQGATGGVQCEIRKNGTAVAAAISSRVSGLGGYVGTTELVYLSGSTDYVELWCVQNSGGAANSASGAAGTHFWGSFVRSA